MNVSKSRAVSPRKCGCPKCLHCNELAGLSSTFQTLLPTRYDLRLAQEREGLPVDLGDDLALPPCVCDDADCTSTCRSCCDTGRVDLSPYDDAVLTHPRSFPGCSATGPCTCSARKGGIQIR